MSRIVFRHEDFALEFHAPELARTLAVAKGNGLDEAALRCAWRWAGDGAVRQVEWQEEGGAGEIIWREESEAAMPEQAFFFDNAEQDVWIEFSEHCSGMRVEAARSADATRFQKRDKVLYGPLEFGNDVGRAEFAFSWMREGVRRRFAVSFDVLSSKLDVRRDWKRIVEDVEAEYRMLSFDFLRRTYHEFAENPEGDHSDRVWWEVFRQVREEFFAACNLILHRPRTRSRPREEWLRADRLRRLPPGTENEWAEWRGDAAHRYRTAVRETTHDTPENRFFKYALRSIARRHGILARRVAGRAEERRASPEFLGEITAATNRLAALEGHPFFRGVGRFAGLKQGSLALQQAPGYAEIARVWALLERLYALGEGLLRLETKDIAELYEIWCFIEVKNRCRAVLDIDERSVRNLARGELGELFGTDLKKGKGSRIVLEKKDPDKGDIRLELFFNPQTAEGQDGSGIEGTEAPTGGAQRPDIVLQLVREHAGNGAFRLTHLFDAKYRIDGRTADGSADKPPEDAINQMHRYRDAIFYRNGGGEGVPKREIIGGYVLFPGNGRPEDIARAYWRRSIDRVGIGALPLRPGNEANGQALQDFIAHLLGKRTIEQLLATIPHKGTAVELEGAISAGTVLASGGGTANDDAEWMYRHKAFFMEAGEYEKQKPGVSPEVIRIVSIMWRPPVTLLVAPGSVLEGITADKIKAQYSGFPRDTGIYHVWFGELANVMSWQKRFKAE